MKRIVAVLLGILILFIASCGVLIYFDYISIPGINMAISKVGMEESEIVSGREIKDTDNGNDYYFATKKENIITDSDTGMMFVDNELLISLTEDGSEEQLKQIVLNYNAEIVGKIEIVNQYQIQFNEDKSLKELEEIEEKLNEYEWIENTSVNLAIELDTEAYYPNDKKWKGQWDEIPEGNNWGMEAIDAPGAWEYKDQMQTVNVGLIDTMFDVNHEDLVFEEMPLGNVQSIKNREFDTKQNNHGTHVAGTLAAPFDNEKGVSGVASNSRLYGASRWGICDYDYGSVMGFEIALSYLIIQKECKVINISMGDDRLAFEASRGTVIYQNLINEWAKEIGSFLKILLENDYDFVICKASGNQNEVDGGYQYRYFHKDSEDELNDGEYYKYADYLTYMNGDPESELSDELKKALSRYKGRIKEEDCESGNVDAKYDIFAAIDIEEVKNRILVVGAVENLGSHKEGDFFGFGGYKVHDGYQIAAFSQCGERVDVVAPGVEIYSTVHGGYDSKDWDGTSMASPHVAGVAALVYSVNPDIRGEQVSEIIRETSQGSYGEEGYGLVNAKLAIEKTIQESEQEEMKISIEDTKISEDREIVLVLDISSSMSGEPIEETKKASNNFIRTILNKDASIGIVTYNSEALIESDFSKNEDNLIKVTDQLESYGGTNIESGLLQAEAMLKDSHAKKKIIVLMSDGEPTDGKTGDELIDCSDEIKQNGIYIYSLGFFSSVSDKTQPQYQMEGIASDGCHYEVENADDLVYFFGDIADQINGQKYIYVRIACPVDVSVTDEHETLCSKEEMLNTRTSFGVMSFEDEISDEESISSESNDNRIKILRLKEGAEYEISIVGNGDGNMDYTFGLMDENGKYVDIRRFEGIQISKGTVVDTTAVRSQNTILKVDEDGDGNYDLQYKAGQNEYGEIVENYFIIYIMLAIGCLSCLMLIIVIRKQIKDIRDVSNNIIRNLGRKNYCPKYGRGRKGNEKYCSNCGYRLIK